MTTPPSVVISYAHGAYDQVCVDLSDRLRSMGVDSEIDAYVNSPEEGWGRWMTSLMTERVVLMVCDEAYYRHFKLGSTTGVGRGVTFESGLLVQRFIESQGRNAFLYPLIHRADDARWIPEFLRGTTRFLIPDEYEQLYRMLTEQPKHPRPALGPIVDLLATRGEVIERWSGPTRRHVPDMQGMLAWDWSVPENFVYVRLSPKPPDRVLIMTDAVKREIVDYAKALPAIASFRSEQQGDGVLFLADDAPVWDDDTLRTDQYDGEHSRIQRALRRCWIRTDGEVEVRLPGDGTNGIHQLMRTMAVAWALMTRFAPLFGAESDYNGRFSYRQGERNARGFVIDGANNIWLEGDLSTEFPDAFLGPVLEAQSASGHAGDAEETRKLLMVHWRSVRLETRAPQIDDAKTTTIVVRGKAGVGLTGATVAAVSENGTVVSGVTDGAGVVSLVLVPSKAYTLLAADGGHFSREFLVGSQNQVDVTLPPASHGDGSLVGLNGIAYIPGLAGRLNVQHDLLDRRFLYAENISINDSICQPVAFRIGISFTLEDASGARFVTTVLFNAGTTFLLDYRRKLAAR